MSIYWLLQGAGIVFSLLYVFLRFIRQRRQRWRFVACAASVYAVTALLILLFQGLFPSSLEERNWLVGLSLYPLLLYAFFWGFRLPVSQMPAVASPMLLIWAVFDRIGCQCVGRCASSISVSWGFFNEAAQKKLLPLQLAEAVMVSILLVFLVVLPLCKKKKFPDTSWAFLLVGIEQFAASFLRGAPKVVFCFSELSLLGLFIAAEGCIWLCARVAFSRLRVVLEL